MSRRESFAKLVADFIDRYRPALLALARGPEGSQDAEDVRAAKEILKRVESHNGVALAVDTSSWHSTGNLLYNTCANESFWQTHSFHPRHGVFWSYGLNCAVPIRRSTEKMMEQNQLAWIANFIWGIADDVLRDVYVRSKYRDVILPLVVLRRLDAVLEPTKQDVLQMRSLLDSQGITNQDFALRQAATRPRRLQP